MGTVITLDIEGASLTYSKNHTGPDHGMLFQDRDRKPTLSDQINYDYFDENNQDPTEMEMSFCRTLKELSPRLELLGYTLDYIEFEYSALVNRSIHEAATIEDEGNMPKDYLSFSDFKKFVSTHTVRSLADGYIAGDDEKKLQGRFFNDPRIIKIPGYDPYENGGYSERSFFMGLISVLHPYSILRLLAENKSNLDSNVIWQYGPLVDAGWADLNEFIPNARRHQTFLIATEGSSDAHILKKALSILLPDIEDFFRFIDVSESHPFSGTGSLTKFAEGLVKIDVQNQVVVLFDNDAEGVDAYGKMQKFTLPSNMQIITLPNMAEFNAFPAQGPNGIIPSNINGRAASIECYLDLNLKDKPPAKVVWTNLKHPPDIYQGALEHKETYTREFLKQTAATVSEGNYDLSKLRFVLDHLVSTCSSIAARHNSSHIEKIE